MKTSEVLKKIKNSKKNGICLNELLKINKNISKLKIMKIISKLVENGEIIKQKEKFYTPNSLNFFNVKIVRDCNKFLIAKSLSEDCEFLIYKKFAKGCLLGDLAICSKAKYKNSVYKKFKEAKVEKIYNKTSDSFTGVIIKKNKSFLIKPDSFSTNVFKIKKTDEKNLKCCDKVVAKISSRGEKYEDIICSIVANCKSSKKAINCANATIILNKLSFSFPDEVLKAANSLKNKIDNNNRLDLTKRLIFTIDSKHAKDLDDAISIEKFKDYYELGVHIADVSHFVKFEDAVDTQAFKRANSIYYANKVIPMLPEVLSNNLCSLNPNEKKLTFSVFIKIDFNGNILNYKLKKTIISSKIKGIYEEINDVFKKNEQSKYYDKYEEILPTLFIMKELYAILKQNKIKRGSPQIETKESIVVLNKKEETVNIKEKKTGIAEEIIEEFMILANFAVADFAKKNNIPFIYRVHKPPKTEKVSSLKKLIKNLNISDIKIKDKVSPKMLSNILNKYKNTELFYVLNVNILRSMEKAEYKPKPTQHFGLVLKNYTHFTSPIRRYCDLMIHRILTDYIFNKTNYEKFKKIYEKQTKKAAKQTSKLEKKTILIERSSLNFFKAEYMQSKIGERLNGEISSIIDRGIFVILKNTVEGFVALSELDKSFKFVENIKLYSKKLNKTYKIGQNVNVICSSVNITLGKIYFKFVD